MATVLEPTSERASTPPPASAPRRDGGGGRPRSVGVGRWVVAAGYAGAAALVLAGIAIGTKSTTGSSSGAAPVVAGASGPAAPTSTPTTTAGATPAAADAASAGGAAGHDHDHATTGGAGATGAAQTDLNGHEISGVKAADVAHEHEPDVPLDGPTRTLVADQLVQARATAAKYPTVADAEAAGYRLVAGFGPGAGAHYIGGPMTGNGPFDPTKVLSLLYAGTAPTSPIVGLMYFGFGDTAPEGFAGPNDHWHRHSSVCTTFKDGKIDVPFAPDSDVTQDQCTAVGGRFMQTTGWMVHAWVVPGWESPSGVFSHENPNVRCKDGTYNTDSVGACEGIA